jgi:hypothetical protein
LWQPTQVGTHMGMTIDLMKGEFRAPTDKLQTLAKQASTLLGRAATTARWLQKASFYRHLVLSPCSRRYR